MDCINGFLNKVPLGAIEKNENTSRVRSWLNNIANQNIKILKKLKIKTKSNNNQKLKVKKITLKKKLNNKKI